MKLNCCDLPTFEAVSALLRYDPETGRIYWIACAGRPLAGQQAGYIGPQGYRRIAVLGRKHMAHRIAWLLARGKWPTCSLDHINGDVDDNRLINLREASYAENNRNQKPRAGSSRYKGVVSARGKWRALIYKNYKRHDLGCFFSEEAAARAYDEGAMRLHGAFARLNFPNHAAKAV